MSYRDYIFKWMPENNLQLNTLISGHQALKCITSVRSHMRPKARSIPKYLAGRTISSQLLNKSVTDMHM